MPGHRPAPRACRQDARTTIVPPPATLVAMRRIRREHVVCAAVIVVGACVFLTGITWGLPSRRADRYLFGDRPAWTGREIRQLIESSPDAARWDDPARGADVD